MADEGKGTAANHSSSRKRNAEEGDRSGNRKRKNISILDFVDDDIEAEDKNESSDDDDEVENTEINTAKNGFYNFTSTSSNPKDHKPKPQKTFWTICHGCKIRYEYLRMYLHKDLVCPNCHERFLAMEIAPLFTKVSTKGLKSRKGKNASNAEEEENESSNDDVEVEEENGSGDDDDEAKESECSDVDISDYTEINIKTTKGEIISLTVKGSDTIGSIKLKVQAKANIPFDQQDLMFKQKVLENTSTFANLRIKKKSTLTVMRRIRGLINIFIKSIKGEIIDSFDFKPSDTIGDVKARIRRTVRIHGIHHKEYVLIFNENVLEDSGVLADLHITEGSTLTLTGKSMEVMEIFVNTFTGKTISLLVNPKSTIREVKWKIFYKERIPFDDQALIYNKTVLGDNATLIDFHIYKKSTLTLMCRSRGGFMQIFIRTFTGNIVTLEVKPSDTIDKIKAKIQNKVNIPCDEQELVFNEKVLHNNDALADYYIKNGSTLTLMRLSNGFMHMFIKTSFFGKTVTLNVKPSDTINAVKSQIEEKEGVRPSQCHLIWEGKKLEETATLADYHIPKESTMHLAD